MRYKTAVVTVFFCAAAAIGYGQTPSTTAPKADNTKVNKRDRNAGQATADQQKTNEGDQALTQKIRQAVMADKTLSTYAHNVKIISQNGVVTLKGPVKTEAEKKSIVAKAVEATGDASKVTDQISIKH
ncbi:BON domain-containing protein [Paludibaculum fermentans]|uniref:BON domain-containing protein n=1 Tax=Paludibaculum fermentans TaxID=1473598 RepID=A0A7S7SI75_PALFE|nr:BON domain-containing protein [Paludibaculum fermentans]QOY86722.1 BON domain-containing protein [Paludibaculum fermentans]